MYVCFCNILGWEGVGVVGMRWGKYIRYLIFGRVFLFFKFLKVFDIVRNECLNLLFCSEI